MPVGAGLVSTDSAKPTLSTKPAPTIIPICPEVHLNRYEFVEGAITVTGKTNPSTLFPPRGRKP
ncbi:hypothetical protein K9N68_34795 (plasmid) [Kovacikia minuta CCNUW1]|uniref:hypothetical protein n=1 Tax=Kovacikia minuta TaxID=2931930 RepID=UPI001CCEFE88|nr:hypothetical protein [Kovacikia minuta]UBF30373.1 hypothetical protein K9N68_34795 [Kovacikia minuta CCNUW1]